MAHTTKPHFDTCPAAPGECDQCLREFRERRSSTEARLVAEGRLPPAPASEPAETQQRYQCGTCGIFVATRDLATPCPLCTERAAHEATKRERDNALANIDKIAAGELAYILKWQRLAAELQVAREAAADAIVQLDEHVAAVRALHAAALALTGSWPPSKEKLDTAEHMASIARAALAATQGTPAVAPRCALPLCNRTALVNGFGFCSPEHAQEHKEFHAWLVAKRQNGGKVEIQAVAPRVPTCEVSGRPCEDNPAGERHCHCRECQAHLRDVLSATQGTPAVVPRVPAVGDVVEARTRDGVAWEALKVVATGEMGFEAVGTGGAGMTGKSQWFIGYTSSQWRWPTGAQGKE